VISVVANIAPKLVKGMVAAALNGNMEEARSIHKVLYPLSKAAFIETNPIPVKTALGMMGRIKPELRMPLCEMRPENEAKLKAVLQKLGVLK